MDLWDYDVRSQPDRPARFATLTALCTHFEATLGRPRIEECIESEKSVFIVRRDSSLEDTMRQFLRRLEAVLQAEVDSRGLQTPAGHESPAR
jgi:hypothetical protein